MKRERSIRMKKRIVMVLGISVVLSFSGCNNSVTQEVQEKQQVSETPEAEQDIKEPEKIMQEPEATPEEIEEAEDDTPTSPDMDIQATTLDELTDTMMDELDADSTSLSDHYEELQSVLDSYENYVQNQDKVESFYENIYQCTKNIGIRMREYSLEYAKIIVASDRTNSEKYDDFDELYDAVYEDAGDEIYDTYYEDIFDELYDAIYDGILDDAYDTIPYEEWSDAKSSAYDIWSDTKSDVYKEWSDTKSDVYKFWSRMKSEVYKEDMEGAEKKIQKFADQVEKMKEE